MDQGPISFPGLLVYHQILLRSRDLPAGLHEQSEDRVWNFLDKWLLFSMNMGI